MKSTLFPDVVSIASCLRRLTFYNSVIRFSNISSPGRKFCFFFLFARSPFPQSEVSCFPRCDNDFIYSPSPPPSTTTLKFVINLNAFPAVADTNTELLSKSKRKNPCFESSSSFFVVFINSFQFSLKSLFHRTIRVYTVYTNVSETLIQ